MKLKLNFILILILFFNVLSMKTLYPENNLSGFTYTISGGPSYVHRDYDRYFTDGYTVGFNTYYNSALFACNTYFKGGVSRYFYNMESSKDSTFRQLDFQAGAGFFYPVFSYVNLLAGVNVHGVYSSLKTDNTGRNEKTFKPGVSYNIGVLPYLGRGIGLFLLYDFRTMEMSNKNLATFGFFRWVDLQL